LWSNCHTNTKQAVAIILILIAVGGLPHADGVRPRKAGCVSNGNARRHSVNIARSTARVASYFLILDVTLGIHPAAKRTTTDNRSDRSGGWPL
jgi:hypothetical protein